MPQYTTSQEAMAAGATKVENAATEIQGHIGALRSEVETMMGGWRGEAASSFMQVHEAFESQANKINTALRRMHEALLATHKTYGSQESNQTQTLTGLAGQING
ncbi:WXG100 family type VII secretion target [uncultured Jatrophihabitans sp.]|uniref:WXG100 family type VII secretion target n=1 Tax=uncultured Jatrophihabitans sp. TaxID=1610747 RepID=UPI0035CC836C